MASNLDEVIKKNKDYLEQAQIDALVAASKTYNLQTAGQRAAGLQDARTSYNTAYRGLQNMGLAGRMSAAPVSGEVPRLGMEIQDNFNRFSQRLEDVQNQRLATLGGNYATQTMNARAAQAAAEAKARAQAEAAAQREREKAEAAAQKQREKEEAAAKKAWEKAQAEAEKARQKAEAAAQKEASTAEKQRLKEEAQRAAEEAKQQELAAQQAAQQAQTAYQQQYTSTQADQEARKAAKLQALENAKTRAAAALLGLNTARTDLNKAATGRVGALSADRDRKAIMDSGDGNMAAYRRRVNEELAKYEAAQAEVAEAERQLGLASELTAAEKKKLAELKAAAQAANSTAADKARRAADAKQKADTEKSLVNYGAEEQALADEKVRTGVAYTEAQKKAEEAQKAYERASAKARAGKGTFAEANKARKAYLNAQEKLERTPKASGIDTKKAKAEAAAEKAKLDGMKRNVQMGITVSDADLQRQQAKYETAKLKAEDPDLYSAYVIKNAQGQTPQATEKANQIIVDRTLDRYGIRKPEWSDSDYKGNVQQYRAVKQMVAQADQVESGGGITDGIAARLKEKYGFKSIDEAREYVRTFGEERDKRSEYNYYTPAFEAAVKNEGLQPSKPVNNQEWDYTYRAVNNLPDMDFDTDRPTKTRQQMALVDVEYMTQQQRDAYNALYETQGIEAANAYAKAIVPIVNIQRAAEDKRYYSELAKDHPVAADIMSVGMNLIGNVPAMASKLVTGVQNAVSGADVPKFIDINSNVNRISTGASTIRGARTELVGSGYYRDNATNWLHDHGLLTDNMKQGLDEFNDKAWVNNTLSFLYQSGMSMADSAAAMAIASMTGPWATDILFFSSAGNEAYNDARQRGATQEEALSYGILSGFNEALFEHVSVETFMENFVNSTPALAKNWLAGIASQSFTEASEEVCTEIANIYADMIALGDKSDWVKAQKQGPEAFSAMMNDKLKGIGMAGLGGLISGLGFGVLGGGMNAVRKSKYGSTIKSDGRADQYMQQARLLGGEDLTYAADSYAKKQSNNNAAELGIKLEERIKELSETKPGAAAKSMDVPAALTVVLEGSRMSAETGNAVLTALGAETVESMGYNATSGEALANSYNERIGAEGITSRSDALAQAADKINNSLQQLRGTGAMGALRRDVTSAGFQRAGAVADEYAQRRGEQTYTAARNAAATSVWANPTQGLAVTQADGTRVTPMPGNMTAVERAEQERTNFQTRSTATKGRVTYAVAGMQARKGLSNEQTYSEIQNGLTKEARKKAQVYEKLADALGVNMVIHDVMTGTNGFIDEKGNMHVVLSGKQSVLRVAAHELTHWMKEHNDTGYASMREHLVKDVGQERFDRMLKQKAREYGIDMSTEKGRTVADDEVCAELCERMLADTDALERFAEKDTEAAKTLKDRLLKILNAIKRALKDIGNRDFGSSWSDLVHEQETIESWISNLQTAIDNATNKAEQSASEKTEDSGDLYMDAETERAQERKARAEANSSKGTYVRGYTAAEVESVIDAGMIGDRSNYEGDDYEKARSMIAQLIPEVMEDMSNGDFDEAQARIREVVTNVMETYVASDDGDLASLREVFPSVIGVDNTAKGDLKAQDQSLFQMSAKLSRALGQRVTLVSEQNAKGQKNAKFQSSEKLDELWPRIRDAYGLSESQDFSVDTQKLLEFIESLAGDRKNAREYFGSTLQGEIDAATENLAAAMMELYNAKNGTQFSLDTDTLRDRTAAITAQNTAEAGGVRNSLDTDYMGLEHRGNGYDGYSMSNNARAAYDAGEMPLSKWTKTSMIDAVRAIDPAKAVLLEGVNTKTLQQHILEPRGWHHTSSMYNRTDFYGIDEELVSELTENEVASWEQISAKPAVKDAFRGDFTYIEWTGTRSHPKANVHTLTNVNIQEKGSFYIVMDDDGKVLVKKKVGSNGTEVKSYAEEARRRQLLQDIEIRRIKNSTEAANALYNEYKRTGYERSASGNIYKYGRKPSRWDYDAGIENFFKEGEQRLSPNGSSGYYVETFRNGSWVSEQVGMKETESNLYSLDTDYMRLAEKYKSGTATETETKSLQSVVEQAAEAAMPNSVARGKDGKLIKFFHGTKAEFTKFERSKIGSTGRFEGSGFNFTPYEGRARSYGGRVLEGYLNIQHPLSADKKTFSVAKLAQLIRNIDPTGDNIIANYARNTNDYGTPSFIRRESMTTARALLEYNESDVDVYSDLSSADPDAESLIRAFSDMGYDGLIHYDSNGNIKTAVAFSSEQFKLADPVTYDDNGNIIPLSERFNQQREDIRYDLDTDAIREAFTVIDTEGMDDALKALTGVKHVGTWALKDISRFLDATAGKDKDLRNTLSAIFEKPHSDATGRYARGVERMQQRVLDIGARAGVVDKNGRHFDAKKSAAIQNIGEGFSNTYTDLKLKVKDADHVTVRAYEQGTEKLVVSERDYTLKELRQAYGTNAADYVWGRVFDETQKAQETGKQAGWVDESVNTRPYTIEDLQAAFPNDWQQLKQAADEFRDMYDEYIRDQNNMLRTIYPYTNEYESVEKIEKAINKKQERLAQHKAAVEQQLQNLQKSLDSKEQEIASKKRTDTKAYRNMTEQANRISDQIAAVKAEIAEYEANAKEELAVMNAAKAEAQNAVNKGDSLQRMHRLQYRSDYFHHFQEMASGIQNLRAIFTNNTDQDISPKIVGRSENTKAKTKWAGYYQQRMGGDYTADALNGMLRYGQLAEYKLAFDPLTAYLRDVNKQIRDINDDTNRDGLIRYIDQWADAIAGKSHKLDRVISDAGMAPRKAMQILNWINSRVIQNTLLYNMRSSLIQISNITNAKGIVTNNLDWMNGLRCWAAAAKGNEAMASIMAQSNFLASRYMDNLQLTESVVKKAKNFGGWLLGALDEVSAKATWWAAYTQYQRNPNAKVIKNAYRTYDNAIDYADDVTRRTHAGRGVGELAPAMTSRVISFVAPFQVEVNNTFELFKDNVKRGNYLGLLSTGLSVFLFNTVFEAIVGSSPLQFDFIRAVMDIVLGFVNDDPEDDDDDYGILQAWQRLSGEAFGSLPYAGQIASIIGEDVAKKIFGEDNDATRYGNTQIGISAVMNAGKGLYDIGKNLAEGKNVRQINWIADLDDLMNLTLPMGGKQLTRSIQGLYTVAQGYAGSNDKEGNEKVQFVTDQDVGHYIHAGLFGKWALTEASEYFGEKRLLPQLFGKYEGPKSSLGKPVDAQEYKAALEAGITGKEYFTLKSDLSKYSGEPGARAEMMEQDFTPEQKAKLDALLITNHGSKTKVEDGVLYTKDDNGDWNKSIKAKDGILYSYDKKNDEWVVKTDYTSAIMFELSAMGTKMYTATRGLMAGGMNADAAMSAARAYDSTKGTPDVIKGVDDRTVAFRNMLFESTAYTAKQKEQIDLAYIGNKYAADYTDKELFELSQGTRSRYEKGVEAKKLGMPVDEYVKIMEKKDELTEKNKQLKEEGKPTVYINGAIREEILNSSMTLEQKQKMDDLLINDNVDPDYSGNKTMFEISMIKEQYHEDTDHAAQAKEAQSKYGMKPELYLQIYRKWSTLNAKDENGKTVKNLKKKRAKEYLESLNLPKDQYDYVWHNICHY